MKTKSSVVKEPAFRAMNTASFSNRNFYVGIKFSSPVFIMPIGSAYINLT
jgi:hypothetical protein